MEGWSGAGWELLTETELPPTLHLALDEVLVRRVGTGLRPPTLRFWGWERQAIVLGSFQSVHNEVFEDAANAAGVEIVRRVSGGGAMFVQPGKTITYSLYLPESLVQGISIAESYAVCDRFAVEALQQLGIEAWYAPLNDIACSRGKIAGAAQARRSGGVLHHTTMAYAMDEAEMRRVLRTGLERRSQKGIVSANKTVAPLNWQTDLSRAALVDALTAHFRAKFGLMSGTVTPEEQAAADTLTAEKYATQKWLYHLP